MKIVLCAAGSGGHIYPALRCAAELRRRWPHCDIRFLSTRRAIEDTIFQQVSYPRIAVDFPRAPSVRGQPLVIFCLKIPRFLIQWVSGCRRVKNVLRAIGPDCVVGFGGLSAATAVIIARFSGIRTLIHEQNAVPGRANQIAGWFATRVAVAYQPAQRFFSARNSCVSGNPVRDDLEVVPGAVARKKLQLSEARFTIAVTGGSQGAQYLNEQVPRALARLSAAERRRVQVVHLSGTSDNEPIRQAYAAGQILAQVFDFRRDMGTVYCAADLLICRAGAMTLAEVQHYGKPAILVPYPYAGSHQRANARFLRDQGAAWLVEQQAGFIEQCATAVRRMMADESLRSAMADKSYALRQDQAVQVLVDLMEQIINGNA